MATQLFAYIAGLAAISFGIGHGVIPPIIKNKNLDPQLAIILKHSVTFAMLFILGTAVMIFKF